MKGVSVVLLCYNQAAFVRESIDSVLSQEYPEIELVVIDDCSEDGSQLIIEEAIKEHPEVTFIRNKENLGNCRSFNKGLAITSGEYIIDLAADDFFLPGKIEKQVAKFDSLSEDYGVIFSDAELYGANGESLGTHMDRVRKMGRIKDVPEGNIFYQLLESYFISSPTQMIKRQVLEELNGYDETLNYEDFDFWIRSSQKWKYAYLNSVLMGIRKVPEGMSSKMYGPDDKKVESTFKIVQKASNRITNQREKDALLSRIKYELRMSFKYGNKEMLRKWYLVYRKEGGKNLIYTLLYYLRG